MTDLDPPSSSANLKRTRAACDGCRRHKRKCDGLVPVCTLCSRVGRSCVYEIREPKKRRYWDEAFVHGLEEEISSLKSRLDATRESQTGLWSPHTDLGIVKTSASRNLSDTGDDYPEDPEITARTTEHPALDAIGELSMSMINLQVGELGEPSFTIRGLASQYENTAPHISRSNLAPMTGAQDQTIRSSIKAKAGNEADVHRNLVQSFLTYVNPFHQIFPLDSAEEVLEYFSDISKEALDVQFLAFTVFAVGACFSSAPNAKELGSKYNALAESICLQSCRDHQAENVVKGLALLCWLAHYYGNDGFGWQVHCLNSGTVLMQGLHWTGLIEPIRFSSPNQQARRDSRIRTFWTYFSLERLNTGFLGMNCAIPWQRIRVPPFTTSLPPEKTGIDELAFDAHGRMWHLWDSCLDQAHAFSWTGLSGAAKAELQISAHEVLTTFYSSLDARLTVQHGDMQASVVYLHVAYNAALLLAHRPFLNEALNSDSMRLALRSVTTAANTISSFIRRLRNKSTFATAPMYIISYIFSASVIHLLMATAGKQMPATRRAVSGLAACINALEDMQKVYSFKVDKTLRRLQELAGRWRVTWALPLRLSYPISWPERADEGSVPTKRQGSQQLDLPTLDSDCAPLVEESICAGWDLDRTLNSLNGLYEMQDDLNLDWLFGNTNEFGE